VSKKIGKPIKPRRPEKKPKKLNRKKKPIKLSNFLKKLAGSVRFWFYKQRTKKTEPNRNRQKTGKKPSQTGKNRAKTEKTEPKPRKPSQNRKNRAKPVWTGFCPKKTEPNRKWSTLIKTHINYHNWKQKITGFTSQNSIKSRTQ